MLEKIYCDDIESLLFNFFVNAIAEHGPDYELYIKSYQEYACCQLLILL